MATSKTETTMEEREAEGFFRTTGKVLFFFAMVFCSVPFFVRRRAENGAADAWRTVGLPFQIRRRHY